MKLLKSLEELLYELVSWLIFYPVAMWRSVVSPLAMLRYAASEMSSESDNQFDETISPPLFLLITLMIAEAVSRALPSVLAPVGDETSSNFLIARGVIFSVFPLFMAATVAHRKISPLTRRALKPYFYGQCFVTAPFAFMFGLAVDLIALPSSWGLSVGLATIALASLWYLIVQVRWFRESLEAGAMFASYLAVRNFVAATVVALLVAFIAGWELQQLMPPQVPGH